MIEYLIESKLKNKTFYRRSQTGFKDLDLAIELAKRRAEESKDTLIEKVRVVRQERTTLKVFKSGG